MAANVDGRPKIDIAQETLTAFVDTLPKEANVALRVYGHIGTNTEQDKQRSCQGSELLYPFQPLDVPTFKLAIASFQPTGWTPIAKSFELAQADFALFDAATNSNLIYLVSDGIETCDGDPVAAARALHEANNQAIVNIIGFDVDTQAAEQLRAAAQAGGGQYYEAHNAAELQDIFQNTFNWREWTDYYSCGLNSANQQLGDSLGQQNQIFICADIKINQEYIVMMDELKINNRQHYEPCLTTISDKINQRYERLKNAIQESNQAALDAAAQEYRQAIEEVEKEPEPGSTPTP